NTVTPIARRRGNDFELDLVLRNNRTNDEHPLGIFHPHADVQQINKENIGLTEVMGLAVLPARSKDELAEIKKALLGEDSHIETYHQPLTKQLKEKYGTITDTNEAECILEKELEDKCARVLEDAGVFKNHEAF